MLNLRGFDQQFIEGNNIIKLALKLKDPSYVGPTIEKIRKYAVGTRLKYENGKIVPITYEVPAVRLPDNFKSLREACEYMSFHHTYQPNQVLGNIGANKDTVILNINHVACDGEMMIELFDAIRDNRETDTPQKIVSVYDRYKEELANAKEYLEPGTFDPNVTRITPKDKGFLYGSMFREKVYFNMPTDHLKCYNKKTGKVHMLTDSYHAQIILAMSAYEGTFKRQGIVTAVNLRQFLKEKQSFENCCQISTVSVHAHATPESTVAEMMNMLRDDLNNILKKNIHFGFYRNFEKTPDPKKLIPGTLINFSNAGKFVIKGPIVDDAYADLSVFPNPSPISTISHIAVIDEEKGRNEVLSTLGYQTSMISRREAQMILNSVKFGLTNIEPEKTTCKKALEMHKQYQEAFIKHEFPKYIY